MVRADFSFVISFVVLGFIALTVSILGIQPLYGQTGINSTANVSGYLTHNGDKYSLQYPESWLVQKSETGSADEAIVIANMESQAAVMVRMGQALPEDAPTDLSQEYSDFLLEQVYSTGLRELISNDPTLTQLQAPEYDKYKVDGHKAGSSMIKGALNQSPHKSLVIGTLVGKDLFFIFYGAPDSAFDQNLPTFENILKSVRFNESGQIKNDSTSSATGYSNYTGDNFSLQYPAGWTVTKEPHPFDPGAYMYRISGDQYQTGMVNLLTAQAPIEEFGLAQNATEAEIESSLEQFFPKFIKSIQSGFEKGEITNTEQPVYNKYTIDGHKAGSVIFSANYGTVTVNFLHIGTLIGNNIIMLSYSAPVEIFDQNLPIAEKILRSIDSKF